VDGNSSHAIAGEFDDLVVKWVKLRVNDGARPTQHQVLTGAVGLCDGNPGSSSLFNGCNNPFAAAAQVAFTQL
jgi:hypothetical protein